MARTLLVSYDLWFDSLSVRKQAREWIDHWDNVSKFNFNAFHLDGLLAFRTTKIDWNFLKAIVRFWDSEDHV